MNAKCDQCGEENPADIHTCTPLEDWGPGPHEVHSLQAHQQKSEVVTQTFEGLPLRKLRTLLSEDHGWSLNGVSIERTEEDGTTRRGAVTTGGMVLWWRENEGQAPYKIRMDLPASVSSEEIEADKLLKPKFAPGQPQCLCKDKCLHIGPMALCKGLQSPLAQPAPVQPVAHCEAGPGHCQQCYLEDRALALAAAVRYVKNNTPKLVSDEICMALTTPPAAPVPDLTHDQWDQWQDKHGLILEREALSELRSMLYTSPAAQPAPCAWTKSNDPNMPDTYEATCGAVWTFTDGGPGENNVRFCPGCGGELVEGQS